MKLLFYTFSQNNSGGFFNRNDEDGIAEYVIIQAASPGDAISRMRQMTEGKYDGYCSCCGERWSYYLDEGAGKEVPSIYGTDVFKYVPNYSWSLRASAFIHYCDGKKEKVNFQDTNKRVKGGQ